MKHSLYYKFILGYLVFGLLGFASIATFSAQLMNKNQVKNQAEAMYDEANLIASAYSSVYQGKKQDLDSVYPQLQAVAKFVRAEIWVVNRQGIIVVDSEQNKRAGTAIEGFDPTATGNKSYCTGTYYWLFPYDVLSVSAPITGNYNTYGYVLVHLPMSVIWEMSNSNLNVVYITAAILFILSLIILLVFTKTVYFPLQKITEGANEYAAGNLEYRIDLNTRDEMGYLAGTLNYMSGELNKLEEYQRNFIANVSHDFRSPLTSIKGYLEAIIDGTIPPEMYEKYLTRVISETERLTMRDQTPEATLAVADRNAPGIAEYIRMKSMQITDRAMLSRGASVIRKKTLIVNLPGSPKAVKESLGFILGALDHGLKILRGTASECARK